MRVVSLKLMICVKAMKENIPILRTGKCWGQVGASKEQLVFLLRQKPSMVLDVYISSHKEMKLFSLCAVAMEILIK